MSNFLFPIETTARELDHKILIGVLSAKKGRKVLIGDQQIIRNLSFVLKGGVFYGKHLFGKPSFSDMGYYNRLKKRGFKILHLNEEGAVWPGTETQWERILKQCERPSKLSEDDTLATWGSWQKEFNTTYESTAAKIVATGHPRFDLYRKRYRTYFDVETQELAKKYGDFILVNTAFSYSNNGEGGVKFIFKPNLAYDTLNTVHRKYRFKRWKRQMLSVADIVDLVNEISLAHPDKKIIIRPHPSEDTQYYRDIFQNIANVEVIYKGAVTPWILACKLMIHNGCTTAIEATLSGKPVVNFSSNYDPDFDVYLANICGVTIDQVSDALAYIEEVYNSEMEVKIPDDKLANRLFLNFQVQNTSENVLKLLEQAEELVDKQDSVVAPKLLLKFYSMLHHLYILSKYTVLAFKGRIKDFVDYKKRFEVFSKADIQARVERMAGIVGVKAKVNYIGKHLISIEAAKNEN